MYAIIVNIIIAEEQMQLFELILISVGLAMDAFAVSVCKGLSMKKMSLKKASIIGLYFGGFQALMPTIGYFLGSRFENVIKSIDHWIIFVILCTIGANMLKESYEDSFENYNDDISSKTMLFLAVATSIDALAIGITFVFLNVNLIFAISLIGVITFLCCVIGVKIGNQFGDKYGKNTELVGRNYFDFYWDKNFV